MSTYYVPPNISASEHFINVKKGDQEAYDLWKKTGSKKHLGELITQLNPLIYSEVSRASGSLPTSALSAEAKKWAVKAIQTYDPTKGAALSTHVTNYLQKVRRLNYKFQNAVRLPENMQLKYNDYNHAVVMLTEELNRDPTDIELASKLGWSKPQTIKFKNSLYSDLIESSSERPGEYTQFNENALLMEHMMSQLDEDEKTILKSLDEEGSKKINSTQLAAKLGVNINRLNYLKKKLTDKIRKIQLESGM